MIFRFLSGPKRHAAVLNALLAKLTLTVLDEEAREAVVNRAREIYSGGGSASQASPRALAEDDLLGHMSEFELYSLYSLAMMELSIEPSIDEMWQPPPRNPFVMDVRERDIAVQSYYLKRHHGIDVDMEVRRPE